MKLIKAATLLSLFAIEVNSFAVSNSHCTRINSNVRDVYSSRIYSSATESGEDSEVAATADDSSKKKAPTHDVRSAGAEGMQIDEEELKIQHALAEHQGNAAKLGWATDIRTLVQYNHGFAVMSTNSKSNSGFPGGSIVGFAPDEDGRPLFVFSGMSSHTQDVLADPRCSLTIASKEFKGAADGRVNLMGNCKRVRDEGEIEAAKKTYLAKHPGAFWVNFGDFNWFRMDIEQIRFVGGFARAGSVTADEYKEAKPDPISAFGNHVAQHMNEDHMDSTIAMIANQIPGLEVEEAIITSVDSLGMYVKCKRTPRASDQPQEFKIRLPFPRQADDRKDVKTIIVEMTQAAASKKEE
jgi:putative heme iron utilization protein